MKNKSRKITKQQKRVPAQREQLPARSSGHNVRLAAKNARRNIQANLSESTITEEELPLKQGGGVQPKQGHALSREPNPRGGNNIKNSGSSRRTYQNNQSQIGQKHGEKIAPGDIEKMSSKQIKEAPEGPANPDLAQMNPLMTLIEQKGNPGLRQMGQIADRNTRDQFGQIKFPEKQLEKSFKNFLKIIKFKHQKHVVLRQDRTTAEDHEENERREKEMHDVKAGANQESNMNQQLAAHNQQLMNQGNHQAAFQQQQQQEQYQQMLSTLLNQRDAPPDMNVDQQAFEHQDQQLLEQNEQMLVQQQQQMMKDELAGNGFVQQMDQQLQPYKQLQSQNYHEQEQSQQQQQYQEQEQLQEQQQPAMQMYEAQDKFLDSKNQEGPGLLEQQALNMDNENNLEQQVNQEALELQQQSQSQMPSQPMQNFDLMFAPSEQMSQVLSKFIEAKQRIHEFEGILLSQQQAAEECRPIPELSPQEVQMLNAEAEEANCLIEELTEQYVQAYQCIMQCVLDRFEVQAENNMLRDANNELKIMQICEDDPRIQELVDKNFFILELLSLVNTYVITESSQSLQNFQKNVKIFPPATIEDYCHMMVNGPEELTRQLINEHLLQEQQMQQTQDMLQQQQQFPGQQPEQQQQHEPEDMMGQEGQQQVYQQYYDEAAMVGGQQLEENGAGEQVAEQQQQESPSQVLLPEEGLAPQNNFQNQPEIEQNNNNDPEAQQRSEALEAYLTQQFNLSIDNFLYMEDINQQQMIIAGLSLEMKKALQEKIEQMEQQQMIGEDELGEDIMDQNAGNNPQQQQQQQMHHDPNNLLEELSAEMPVPNNNQIQQQQQPQDENDNHNNINSVADDTNIQGQSQQPQQQYAQQDHKQQQEHNHLQQQMLGARNTSGHQLNSDTPLNLGQQHHSMGGQQVQMQQMHHQAQQFNVAQQQQPQPMGNVGNKMGHGGQKQHQGAPQQQRHEMEDNNNHAAAAQQQQMVDGMNNQQQQQSEMGVPAPAAGPVGQGAAHLPLHGGEDEQQQVNYAQQQQQQSLYQQQMEQQQQHQGNQDGAGGGVSGAVDEMGQPIGMHHHQMLQQHEQDQQQQYQQYTAENGIVMGGPQVVQGNPNNEQTQEYELIQDSDGQQWLCPIIPNTGLCLRHVHIAKHIQDVQMMQQQASDDQQHQDQQQQHQVMAGQQQQLMPHQEAVQVEMDAAAVEQQQQQQQQHMMAQVVGHVREDEAGAGLQEGVVQDDQQQMMAMANNTGNCGTMQQHHAQAQLQDHDQSTMPVAGPSNAPPNGVNMHTGYNYQQQSAQEASAMMPQQQQEFQEQQIITQDGQLLRITQLPHENDGQQHQQQDHQQHAALDLQQQQHSYHQQQQQQQEGSMSQAEKQQMGQEVHHQNQHQYAGGEQRSQVTQMDRGQGSAFVKIEGGQANKQASGFVEVSQQQSMGGQTVQASEQQYPRKNNLQSMLQMQPMKTMSYGMQQQSSSSMPSHLQPSFKHSQSAAPVQLQQQMTSEPMHPRGHLQSNQQQTASMPPPPYPHQHQNSTSLSQQPQYQHSQQQQPQQQYSAGATGSFQQPNMHQYQSAESKGMTLAELQEKISGSLPGRAEEQQPIRGGVAQAAGQPQSLMNNMQQQQYQMQGEHEQQQRAKDGSAVPNKMMDQLHYSGNPNQGTSAAFVPFSKQQTQNQEYREVYVEKNGLQHKQYVPVQATQTMQPGHQAVSKPSHNQSHAPSGSGSLMHSQPLRTPQTKGLAPKEGGEGPQVTSQQQPWTQQQMGQQQQFGALSNWNNQQQAQQQLQMEGQYRGGAAGGAPAPGQGGQPQPGKLYGQIQQSAQPPFMQAQAQPLSLARGGGQQQFQMASAKLQLGGSGLVPRQAQQPAHLMSQGPHQGQMPQRMGATSAFKPSQGNGPQSALQIVQQAAAHQASMLGAHQRPPGPNKQI